MDKPSITFRNGASISLVGDEENTFVSAKLPPIVVPPAEEIVKKMIDGLRERKTGRRRQYRQPNPLWSRVSALTGHGSGYSSAICTAYGFDPDEIWRPET